MHHHFHTVLDPYREKGAEVVVREERATRVGRIVHHDRFGARIHARLDEAECQVPLGSVSTGV